jgi:hypothetical protein
MRSLSGRDVDISVAERLLGWRWVTMADHGPTEGWDERVDEDNRPVRCQFLPPDAVPDGSGDWRLIEPRAGITRNLSSLATVPLFSADDGAAWSSVRPAMEHRGFSCYVESGQGGHTVTVTFLHGSRAACTATAETLAAAMCDAAFQSVIGDA